MALQRHGVRKHKERLLIFGQQAREQEPLGIKSTHTDAQEENVCLFVSHSGGTINFSVTWRDNAENEQGYRILRNGEQIAELPANSTAYTDSYNPPVDQSVEYYIQVYGPSGSGNTYVGSMRC